MHPVLRFSVNDFHMFRALPTSCQERPPSALDTIGSVRERIAIFETLSTDDKLVSTCKGDNLSELAEVPKHERYSPFREGPSEPHDEPKIVPCKPESDQSDTKETGKQGDKTQSKTYCGYNETEKDRNDDCRYNKTQKDSGTLETVGVKRTKQKNANKSVRNTEKQKLVRWEQKPNTGPPNKERVLKSIQLKDADEIRTVTGKRLPKQFEITGKEIQSKGIGVTLGSESTTWKKIPTEYFGLEKVLLENETVKDKTLILQHIKGLPMKKLKFKRNECMLSEELTRKGDIYSDATSASVTVLYKGMSKPKVLLSDEVNITSVLLEKPTKKSTAFLDGLTGNIKKKECKVSPVEAKIKRKESSVVKIGISKEILQPEKLKAGGDIMSMAQEKDLNE
uniref:Uncharacterized protein n=1 Tax=Wuchereria bancrofti TaxID=6293 RepID=A0AAF5PHZ0_WUCBA